MKKINKKYITVFLVIILISIGFAALATQLSILGTANVSHQTWDIYWDNVEVTDGSVTAETPVINPKTKVSYVVSLVKPGDFFEFTVDAVNNGTIDAMIDTITNSSLTADQLKYINYSVTYKINNKAIQQGHKLDAGKKITYKVRLEYRKDIDPTDLGDSDETLNLSFEVTYKQANNSATDPFTYAMFDTGLNVKNKFQTLSNNDLKNIIQIKRADEIDNAYKTNDNKLSASNSSYSTPVYGWFDDTDGTFYYYSDSDIIYFAPDSKSLFSNLINVTSIDFTNIDTSKAIEMTSMFYYCISLSSLDLSNFDTSNVTDMSLMFYAIGLDSIDITHFDTSNVTNMSSMFATGGTSDLSSINIENIDTSKVKNMNGMFSNCRNVTSINLKNIKTNNVEYMARMFEGCSKLESLDLSSFDTSKVQDMSRMFADYSLTSLDLSGFDTSSVTNMYCMFNNASKLVTIYVSDKFVTDNVTNSSGMFQYCSKLVGENNTKYNSSNIDATYAKVDGKIYDVENETWITDSTVKGYFTLKTA